VSISGQVDVTTLSRHLVGGTTIAPHRHEENQVVYASQGVLAVTTEDGSWMAPADRAIWVPAGVVHQHRAYGTTALHTVGVPVSTNPLRLAGPALLLVSPLLRELVVAYTGRPDDQTQTRRRLLAVLLDELRVNPLLSLHLPTARDPRLVDVCALLENDPADGRALAQLGAVAGVSERTLARLFREELGMTFPQWRTSLRLQLALRLLAEGASVTAVGGRCGWSSTSAFIDVFRRNIGATPGQVFRGDIPAALPPP